MDLSGEEQQRQLLRAVPDPELQRMLDERESPTPPKPKKEEQVFEVSPDGGDGAVHNGFDLLASSGPRLLAQRADALIERLTKGGATSEEATSPPTAEDEAEEEAAEGREEEDARDGEPVVAAHERVASRFSVRAVRRRRRLRTVDGVRLCAQQDLAFVAVSTVQSKNPQGRAHDSTARSLKSGNGNEDWRGRRRLAGKHTTRAR